MAESPLKKHRPAVMDDAAEANAPPEDEDAASQKDTAPLAPDDSAEESSPKKDPLLSWMHRPKDCYCLEQGFKAIGRLLGCDEKDVGEVVRNTNMFCTGMDIVPRQFDFKDRYACRLRVPSEETTHDDGHVILALGRVNDTDYCGYTDVWQVLPRGSTLTSEPEFDEPKGTRLFPQTPYAPVEDELDDVFENQIHFTEQALRFLYDAKDATTAYSLHSQTQRHQTTVASLIEKWWGRYEEEVVSSVAFGDPVNEDMPYTRVEGCIVDKKFTVEYSVRGTTPREPKK